ncbi:MAG: SDR family NAD(P)-dependent oxidoreductase [Microscillaceae bacterium]|nr:SDR family NAD(P)-dependent oxidoreductase [Microscillaceae bacterium]
MRILENKIGIICGINNQLGKALIKSLENEGVKLLLVDSQKEDSVSNLHQYFLFKEGSQEQNTLAYLEEAQQFMGGVHLLVLNDIASSVQLLSEKIKVIWQEIKLAIPFIAKSGGGSIVIISSQIGTDQAAMAGLVRSVATEAAKLNVRINLIVRPENQTSLSDLENEKIARLVLSLADDKTTLITGSLHHID